MHSPPSYSIDREIALLQESYSKYVRAFMRELFPEPGTEYVKEWGFRVCQKTTKEVVINYIENSVKKDLRPLLGKINIPTLIIYGEKDTAAPLEAARYLHEKIAGSKMYIFKGKGHLPSVTAAYKFNKMLREFITTGNLMKD